MRSWIALATLMLTGWFGSGAALAQPAKISRSVADDLGLFSADAESKANAVIARIKQQHGKDFVIETTRAPKKPAGLDENDKTAVARHFDQWAATRFKNQQINGVYVVILDKPKIIRVVVGAKTLEKGLFTTANRDELFNKIQEKLKEKDADGALLGAVNYVGDTMHKNARTTTSATPQAAPPANKPGVEESDDTGRTQVQASPIIKWLLIGLAILLVFWLVSAIIRGLSGMGAGAGGYSPGGYGGGGFLNGFLGGLFGAAAGMWMYSHFFGGGTPSASAGPTSPGGYNPNEATDVGAGEPSVGGGDYGTGAVEEPTDAGDWGGGDVGGGDFGGGGDWGGGGGGDW